MFIEDDQQWKGTSGTSPSPGFWDLRLRAQIGRDLRAQYENALNEPLPERLATLLSRLEKRERAHLPKYSHEPA